MGFTGFGTFALAQFSDELISIDLAPNPQSGYVLTTDGTNNTWSVATGGSGGSDSLWALNTSGNYVYSDSASTTATTSARSYFFTATSTADASTFPYASSTSLTSSGNAWLNLASSTGFTSTRLFFTNATGTSQSLTTLGVGTDYITDITGTGLINTNGVLSISSSSLNIATNWAYNGSRLSPSTTVGIGVFASSTIGDGTATGGLTISGSGTTTGTSTMHNLVVGGYGQTLQAGMTEPSAFVNASTSGRSGMILQNYGTGTAPEYRFIVGDPYSASGLEYIGFGLTNSGATSGGALQSLQKTDLAYVISNSGRDLLVTAGGGATAGNLYLGAGANTLPVFKLDGSTNRVGINLATTTTPTSTLSVNGDIYYANSIATGTATSVNMIATSILRAPYGSAPTVVTNGDHAIDSTSNQFKYQANGGTYVLGNGTTTASFYYSTTTAWTGTTTIGLGPAPWAETWSAVRCRTDTGTINVDFGDGTNYTNATTSVSANPAPRHALTSNNTFTAGERREVRMGTPASSPTSIACTVYKSITAD